MIRRHSIGGSLDPEKTREYETFADRFNACFSALLVSSPLLARRLPFIDDDA